MTPDLFNLLVMEGRVGLAGLPGANQHCLVFLCMARRRAPSLFESAPKREREREGWGRGEERQTDRQTEGERERERERERETDRQTDRQTDRDRGSE